jgi:hypothetical protein
MMVESTDLTRLLVVPMSKETVAAFTRFTAVIETGDCETVAYHARRVHHLIETDSMVGPGSFVADLAAATPAQVHHLGAVFGRILGTMINGLHGCPSRRRDHADDVGVAARHAMCDAMGDAGHADVMIT